LGYLAALLTGQDINDPKDPMSITAALKAPRWI
jgi:hypothetical protein